MLNEAIKLSKQGFRLIPCNGKIPLMKKWQLNATNNENKIKQLWENNDYNIGILTGEQANNLIVLDCDVKDDINGISNFINYLKSNNITLPDTLIATTGRGGKHYYFKSEASNLKSGTNIFDKGIDIRANGGFIIAPPSLHPNGNRYSWDNNVPIAKLPPELEKLIIEFQTGTKKEKSKQKERLKKNPKYNELPCIEIGERNETLFRLSSKLIECGLCYNAILEAISIENELKCVELLSEAEITNIVNSAYKYKSDGIIANSSINKIFSSNYNTTTISIYWCIWYLSLKTLKGKIYINQKELCNMLNLKAIKTLRDNIKPLLEDGLISRKRERNIKGGYGVYSYKIN